MEQQLVSATWALAVATAFLAIAASIPLVRDVADRRARRRVAGAKIVPDMNILRSRLTGACDRLAVVEILTAGDLEEAAEQADEDIGIIGESIIESGERPSLEFVNEIYVTRHFLTQAKYELLDAHLLDASDDRDDVRKRDEAIRRARRCYKGAQISLDTAERLLAPAVRAIGGESFWDRFERVIAERETEAGRSLVGPEGNQESPG